MALHIKLGESRKLIKISATLTNLAILLRMFLPNDTGKEEEINRGGGNE